MTQKFIRRNSELPVDAPLSATDGFVWSRLEAPQTVDELARATGLGEEQVHASLKTLMAAGLIGPPRAPTGTAPSEDHVSSRPQLNRSANRPVQLSRLIEMGHLALDQLPATMLWPELTDSRQTAFGDFRIISDTWLARFKGLRGSERIRGRSCCRGSGACETRPLTRRVRKLHRSAPG